MSGTNTPPTRRIQSQFNENWALEPTVMANYAKPTRPVRDARGPVAKSRNPAPSPGFRDQEYTNALVEMEGRLPASARCRTGRLEEAH